MKYTQKIRSAIKFSVKTHEVYQKQKRKGINEPAYITHPLTVGLILSLAGADEDVIVAGILHDTIEDCVKEKKVDKKMLRERFGQRVADLVMSVTETHKEWAWEKRKGEALKHIKKFSHEELLLKSADVLSNINELAEDHNRYGDEVFKNFSAPKEKLLENFENVIRAILGRWEENPLGEDLEEALEIAQRITRNA